VNAHHPSEHMRSRVKYKCKICLQLLPSIISVRSHFSSWHLKTMVYKCRLCSDTLKTKKSLNHHMKVFYKTIAFASASTHIFYFVQVIHSEVKKRDCSICNKEFSNKRAYTIHFRMKHNKGSKVGFRCRICQKKFDTKEQR
jgi:RNase P subunit RPR2